MNSTYRRYSKIRYFIGCLPPPQPDLWGRTVHHQQAVGAFQYPCHADLCGDYQREEAGGGGCHSADWRESEEIMIEQTILSVG